MAVKDRTKPIQHIATGNASVYLGESKWMGLQQHVVQTTIDRTLMTGWFTDEDFDRLFENMPEPEAKPLVDPAKPIKLRREAWTDPALLMAEKVKCVQCIPGYRYFVRIEWMDGRIREEWWQEKAFQEHFENVPEESPVASVTVDGEKLSGVKSVDIECDNGAAPEPHKGNGKAEREIDWSGEVECRLRGADKWVPFRVCFRSDEFDDLAYGIVRANRLPMTCRTEHWEFRNKPKPEPDPKWEAAMDGRPIEHHVGLDYRDELGKDERLVVYQVWMRYPKTALAPDWPVVIYTHTSRREAMRFLINQQSLPVRQGYLFTIAPCAAPVMPKAAEANA